MRGATAASGPPNPWQPTVCRGLRCVRSDLVLHTDRTKEPPSSRSTPARVIHPAFITKLETRPCSARVSKQKLGSTTAMRNPSKTSKTADHQLHLRHALNPALIMGLETWRCPYHTFRKRYCPLPKHKPTKGHHHNNASKPYPSRFQNSKTTYSQGGRHEEYGEEPPRKAQMRMPKPRQESVQRRGRGDNKRRRANVRERGEQQGQATAAREGARCEWVKRCGECSMV